MRSCVLLFLCAALVSTNDSVPAADGPKVTSCWAVLIGVDDYVYAQKLQYCGADQRALRDRLVASGFPDDQVFLLHDKTDNPKMKPSRGNVERQLGVVLQLAEPDDLVVVSFSGHGVNLDGKSYLCPGDCTLEDAATMVSLDGVYDRLQACAARFKLVVVDACRNDPRPGGARSLGPTEGSRALARNLQETKLPEGVVLLNSCAPGEISWEDEKFGHGVFMNFVLDALSGAGDSNADGNLSLVELESFAAKRTKTYVANSFSSVQRPFFRGDLTSEALEYGLFSVPAKQTTPPSVANTTNASPPNGGKSISRGSSAEFASLFNGKNFDGWSAHGLNDWTIRDGAISGEADQADNVGWLMSDEVYGNFELELEYKLAPNSSSGVFLRANPTEDVRGSNFHEVQLLDDSAPQFSAVVPSKRNGAIWGRLDSSAPPTPPNQWHRLHVYCYGSHIRVEVNGVAAAEGELLPGRPSTGHLGLQLYPHKVEFRGIRVRPLEPDGSVSFAR